MFFCWLAGGCGGVESEKRDETAAWCCWLAALGAWPGQRQQYLSRSRRHGLPPHLVRSVHRYFQCPAASRRRCRLLQVERSCSQSVGCGDSDSFIIIIIVTTWLPNSMQSVKVVDGFWAAPGPRPLPFSGPLLHRLPFFGWAAERLREHFYRASALTRGIDIAILSVCRSVRPLRFAVLSKRQHNVIVS